MAKFISAAEAAALIRDGDTVGLSCFSSFGVPEEILEAIDHRYAETGSPKNIVAVNGVLIAGVKENGTPYGFDHLVAEGLLRGVYLSNMTGVPRLLDLIQREKVFCFTMPLGVMSHLYRAMAGRKPGILTHVGLHTCADPRLEGCCANNLAKESGIEAVRLMEINGKEQLFYPSIPMDICILRGTYADEDGNIVLDHEAAVTDVRELATAVHNNGGIVVVQVKEVVRRGTLDAKSVVIHKSCVDYVVKAAPKNHRQAYLRPTVDVAPELLGQVKITLDDLPDMEMGVRKVIARRAAMELMPNALVNLGIGMAEGVSTVAKEEGIGDRMTLSIETGVLGGVSAVGILGACVNPEAVYSMADIMDLYDGGGLDQAFLSAAQVDEQGNVNVTKFGPRITGPGGFINISQNTPRICFLGTFTAGKSKLEIGNGELHILEDGPGIKFKRRVEQVSFSALYAQESGQEILYITERAVFRLTQDGPVLIEIAPGVDLQKDILDKMEFVPSIAPELKLMDARIFRDEQMGIAND